MARIIVSTISTVGGKHTVERAYPEIVDPTGYEAALRDTMEDMIGSLRRQFESLTPPAEAH